MWKSIFLSLTEDFALQARVLNKPYDIFGCWLNNSHLLSGNLHYLGHLSSCSALWLNKATQEVDSEQESVVMRLFKFLNINASTVRSIAVANCRNLGKGEEMRAAKAQLLMDKMDCSSSASPAKQQQTEASASCEMHHHGNGNTTVQSSSESEVDTKASAYESDNEMTASDEPEVLSHKKLVKACSCGVHHDNLGATAAGVSAPSAMHHSKSEPCLTCGSRPGEQGSKPVKRPCPVKPSPPQRSSPVKRDVSDVSGSPPSTPSKSLRTDGDAGNKDQSLYDVPSTSGASTSGASSDLQDMQQGEGGGESCYTKLWSRVRQAEIRRGGENLDEDLLKILIDGDPDYSTESHLDTPSSTDSPMMSLSDNAQLESLTNTGNDLPGEQPMDYRPDSNRQSAAVSSRCSSTDTVLSSPDTEQGSAAASVTAPLTFAAESGSASDIIRAWGKQFTFGSTDSLDDEPPIHYPERRRGFSDPEVMARLQPTLPEYEADDTSTLSSSSMSDPQDFSSQRTKVRRRKNAVKDETKHLIFTRGSQAYTPHQIGIKRIESCDSNTLRGPLGMNKHEGQRSKSEGGEGGGGAGGGGNNDLDFDKVDYVIELNGHAIGMALSPDHR